MGCYYTRRYNGCEYFLRIIDWMPYIIELDFEGGKLVSKQEHCHVEKEFKGNSVQNVFAWAHKVY